MSADEQAIQALLDQCVDQIIAGEPVEASSAMPGERAELEPLLAVASSLGQAAMALPSGSAMAMGRARLFAALDALHEDEARPRSTVRTMLDRMAGVPRWALASAAVLTVVAAGAATVLAALDTAPGEPLHVVKRAYESTQVLTARSQEERVALSLAQAEERAREAGRLLLMGDRVELEGLTPQLVARIEAAGSAMPSASGDEDGERLGAAFARSASAALGSVQTVAGWLPESEREPARLLLAQAGAAYADALETSLVQAAGSATASVGTLEVRVASYNSSQAGSLSATVEGVDVSGPGAGAGRWVTVVGTPMSVDLSTGGDAQTLLGRGEIDEGSYTRIRVRFSTARVTSGGVTAEASITQSIVLDRPFLVQAGGPTVLALSFDETRTLEQAGVHGEVLEPVVLVYAYESGQQAPPLAEVGGPESPVVDTGLDEMDALSAPPSTGQGATGDDSEVPATPPSLAGLTDDGDRGDEEAPTASGVAAAAPSGHGNAGPRAPTESGHGSADRGGSANAAQSSSEPNDGDSGDGASHGNGNGGQRIGHGNTSDLGESSNDDSGDDESGGNGHGNGPAGGSKGNSGRGNEANASQTNASSGGDAGSSSASLHGGDHESPPAPGTKSNGKDKGR